MQVADHPLLDSLSALSDPTRCRLLLVLDRQELTVSELCSVLQLPQSTVSRHLKLLADASWARRGATHQPLLQARAGKRRRRPAVLVAALREAGGLPSGRGAGSAPSRARPGGARPARWCSSQRPRAMGRLGAELFGRVFICWRSSASSRPTRGRRSRVRHGPAARRRRAVRRAGGRGGRVGGMLAAARARPRQMPDVDLRRGRSKRCRSTTARSTPRP